MTPEIFQLELPSGNIHVYEIKPSKRAKHIRIKLSNTGELSVTLPTRVSKNEAHRFVQSKSLWIEKHLLNLPEQKQKTVPNTLNLRLLNEVWTVSTDFIHNHPARFDIDKNNQTIHFSGDEHQIDDFRQLLSKWLKKKSKPIFTQMLETTAEEYGFHYNKISIRAQKTRWGSCSSGKNISLNCKLLFMPENVVRYVLIHELCHTIQMNHSQKFWDLVEDCDPLYKENRKGLKQYDTL